MSLINCPECNHPMIDEAVTCPNCHKPRIVGNTKNCSVCGTLMEARKRKCPECEAPQYDTIPNAKTKTPMATQKRNSTSSSIAIFVLALILGAGIMFAYFYSQQAVAPDQATVTKQNGLYVFINSFPAKATESIGHFEIPPGDQLTDLFGTKGKTILDKFNDLQEALVFDRKLNAILLKVKGEYPQAECVVFTGRLDKCDVYKFQ